jgi:hypothetical protein
LERHGLRRPIAGSQKTLRRPAKPDGVPGGGEAGRTRQTPPSSVIVEKSIRWVRHSAGWRYACSSGRPCDTKRPHDLDMRPQCPKEHENCHPHDLGSRIIPMYRASWGKAPCVSPSIVTFLDVVPIWRSVRHDCGVGGHAGEIALTQVSSTEQHKRRHHFVPVAYLKHFADADGKIFAYRKHTDRREPIHSLPKNVALTWDYYAQPKTDGSWDYNRLENMFAAMETKWPTLVARMEARASINDSADYLFEFLGAMRVRVPASRDAAETIDREGVKATMRLRLRQGDLPPLPGSLTLDDIDVTIDPHRSIHAMPQMARGFGVAIHPLGFEVLCNETGVPIITNDNPVMYFDADRTIRKLQPYRSTGKTELLMPISRTRLLRGHPDLKPLYGQRNIAYRTINSAAEVRRINTLASMFGYDFVFAASREQEAIIGKYLSTAPILRTKSVHKALIFEMVFGPKPRKPKWKTEHRFPLPTSASDDPLG